MTIKFSKSISENIKKIQDPLMEGIEQVKDNLSFRINCVNNMNQVFQEAERKLKILSLELEQEGMDGSNGNN